MDRNIARLVDANVNRVSEGLRVVEDVCRYYANDSQLQQALKTLRHRFMQAVPCDNHIMARNAAEDVGFAAQGDLKSYRRDLASLCRANMKRAQEGLRVLEEVFRLATDDRTQKIKTIRYAVYDIERDLMARVARKRLRRGLYLIMTDPPMGYTQLAESAVQAKIPAVQLRCKQGSTRERLALARQIRKITAGSETLFIVNDSVDITLLAEADGLHVGQEDIPPGDARELIGHRCILGFSTHNLAEVEKAQREPVDYIGFGPIYATISKGKTEPITGTGVLQEAIRQSNHPVVAVGGINAERLRDVAACLPHNAAIISMIADADDPYGEMKKQNALFLEIS